MTEYIVDRTITALSVFTEMYLMCSTFSALLVISNQLEQPSTETTV